MINLYGIKDITSTYNLARLVTTSYTTHNLTFKLDLFHLSLILYPTLSKTLPISKLEG